MFARDYYPDVVVSNAGLLERNKFVEKATDTPLGGFGYVEDSHGRGNDAASDWRQ